jgi:hypothetical protein
MAEMSEDQQYFNEILKTGVGAGCSDIRLISLPTRHGWQV